MMKWLLLVALVLAACERVVDLTPDATFAKQPDASIGTPDAANELDDGGTIGDGDAPPPPDAAVFDSSIDAL